MRAQTTHNNDASSGLTLRRSGRRRRRRWRRREHACGIDAHAVHWRLLGATHAHALDAAHDLHALAHAAEGDVAAVMCFAFTNGIPKSIEEMDTMSRDAAMQAVHRAGVQGSTAIAYTVWAKKKGGGKHIVNEVYKMIKESNHLNRLVTLSPLTEMAEKFHLKNGAKCVGKHLTTQNFEYDIELDQWEKLRDRAKGWFNIR